MASNIDLIKTLGPLIIRLEEDKDIQRRLFSLYDDEVAKLERAINEAKGQDDRDQRLAALSAGLPAISKGVIDAVKAFRSNDPFAGSAAVIEVTSAMITTVSGIAGVAGPPGMIVGSLLSVLSMILQVFSDQKPTKSLQQQLDEVLRNFESEKKLEQLRAARKLIDGFIGNLSKNNLEPLTYTEILATYAETNGTSLRLMIMEAAEWLKNEKNQELELWDSVLAAQCLTFISYNQSMLMILKIAKTEDDIQKVNDYLVKSFHPIQLEFLNDIIEVVRNRGIVWAGQYASLSSRKHAVVSGSKREWQNSGKTADAKHGILSLAVTTKPLNSNPNHQTSDPVYVQFSVENIFDRNRLPGGWQNEWTQEKYEQQKNYPFQQENAKDNILRCRFGRPPFQGSMYLGHELKDTIGRSNEYFPIFDVYTLPEFSANKVFVYTAHGSELYIWDYESPKLNTEINKYLSTRRGMRLPDGYNSGAIRAAFPEPLPEEDQDQFAIPYDESNPKDADSSPGGEVESKERLMKVVYGACEVSSGKSIIKKINPSDQGRDHMEIKVYYFDFPKHISSGISEYISGGSIMSPWRNYVGIATDRHYLWVYRAGAIACASHSSVKRCLENELEKPDWMIYNIPKEGISKLAYDPESVGYTVTPDYDHIYFKRGLIDLSACEDGTLTAVYSDGVYVDWKNQNHLYSLTPEIKPDAKDLSKRLLMKGKTRQWKTDRTVNADLVVKQPMFCWALIDGLKASLEKYTKL